MRASSTRSQAAQGVRAVADEVAPSVYEDGAAVVLESLLD